MINLILCGGVGSRLWPVSRKLMPKQFFPLFGNKSLFELTVKRNQAVADRFMVASNKEQSFLAFEQLAGMGFRLEEGLIEPVGRNTAPAIALVCFNLEPEELVLVTPSDHLVTKEESYSKAIARAKALAEDGKLVTFGIHPDFPETGFGYIEAQGETVLSFREKPNYKTAQEYIKSGNYFWNSGMFLFKAATFLEELKVHAPEVYATSRKAFDGATNQSPLEIKEEDMLNIPPISIDYAVMEHSKKVAVVPCEIGWSDLGSFDSVYDQTYNPEKENAILGSDEPILINSRKNLIMGHGRKIALVDVDNLLVVDSPDALLVAQRGSSQKVKEVVAELKEKHSDLLDAPQTVKRPWGKYTVLQDRTNFKVKRIDVNPGKRLSLQKHKHRKEHWTVVEGTARVRVGDEEKVLVSGQDIFIPLGAIHRLENAGSDKVRVIEVQTGDYFGEDDIVRLEDDWGRT
jgi:mannose-1-phosphate guanylyltransferase